MKYFYFLAILLVANPANSRTWNVEKDGSGDFTIIQDAINASSSGDTIQVGTGRFNDHSVDYCTESNHPARVVFNKEELTLIGSGPENTIIGQEEPWELSQGRHMGIVVGRCGNLRYSISNLKVENSFFGVLGGAGTEGKINGCVLKGHGYGLVLHSNEVEVTNSVFHTPTDNATTPSHFVFYGDNNLLLNGCQFQSNFGAVLRTNHFINMSPAAVFIEDCTFEGGEIGVWSYGGQASINTCSFSNIAVFAVGSNGDNVTVRDSQFSDLSVGIWETDTGGHLEVERCEFRNISLVTYYTTLSATGFFRDCLLEKGERYVVAPPLDKMEFQGVDNKEISHFDMTDNWWGTTDPDSIQDWILDRNDFPEYPFFQVIDFEPFKQDPVPTEKTSLGGLKALFQSDQ